ncbi:MAG: hypothetical protein JO304_18595 [Solirubrobacterales bacterium]|nr:hypothetical protein [Solirubrobacterales bacterium]
MLRTDPSVVFDRRRLAWGLLRLIGLVGMVVLAISRPNLRIRNVVRT